jgi:hypothetical protein
MTASVILQLLGARALTEQAGKTLEVRGAICSDSMSDVLCFSTSGSLLLTGITNPQAVRTAEVADIPAVCFVQGKQPAAETVALAREKGILLLSTPLSSYESCGRLYAAGLRGCDASQ